MAQVKASPRKGIKDFRRQRRKLFCLAERLLDLKTKLPHVKRGGISSENGHSVSRLFIVLRIALETQ